MPASRRSLFKKLRPLIAPNCPFVNLPEIQPSRFGRELDTETMKKAYGFDRNWWHKSIFWNGPTRIGSDIRSSSDFEKTSERKT